MNVARPVAASRRRFLALAAAGLGVSCARVQPLIGVLPTEGNLPTLDVATAWLNSGPLTAADLRGKVVLVQFWTFTCINWLRTLPYIRAWAQKYKDQGLVVIGVHTPEFSFEHHLGNVRQAANTMRVDYPIAIDNDYAIWNAFANQYWPALYFVDAMGRIRHHYPGEGAYEESERVIQQLLGEAGVTDTGAGLVTVDAQGAEVAADWGDLQSTETYLGFNRTQNFGSSGGVLRNSPRVYSAPAQLKLNQWALDGNWIFEAEAVRLNDISGRLVFQFHARDLHLVMGPTTPGSFIPFSIRLDGVPPGAAHGVDIDEQGNGILAEQRLHQLVRQPVPVADRRFEIQFSGPSVGAYDFTFG